MSLLWLLTCCLWLNLLGMAQRSSSKRDLPDIHIHTRSPLPLLLSTTPSCSSPCSTIATAKYLVCFSLALYCLCDCPLAPVSCFLLPLPSTRRCPAQLLAQTGLDKYFSAHVHIFAFMWNMRPLRQIRNHSQRQ